MGSDVRPTPLRRFKLLPAIVVFSLQISSDHMASSPFKECTHRRLRRQLWRSLSSPPLHCCGYRHRVGYPFNHKHLRVHRHSPPGRSLSVNLPSATYSAKHRSGGLFSDQGKSGCCYLSDIPEIGANVLTGLLSALRPYPASAQPVTAVALLTTGVSSLCPQASRTSKERAVDSIWVSNHRE